MADPGPSNLPPPGAVRVASEVLDSIAATAATSVAGVAGMCDPSGGPMARLLHHRASHRGVRSEMVGATGVRFDLYLAISSRAALPQLTKDVQARVSESVHSMLGLDVVELDLHVAELAGD